MYRTINDFLKQWDVESTDTLNVFERITPTAAERRIDEGGKSLRELAWHITTSIGGVMTYAGLKFESPGFADPVPDTMQEIIEAYRRSAAAAKGAIATQWTDETLLEQVEMWGMLWMRGFAMTALALHQAHHRGQMTVVMRQAGLIPPAIYGPTREDMVPSEAAEAGAA